MELDLKIKGKVIGTLFCSDYDHDCVVGEFGQVMILTDVHVSDDQGNLQYLDGEGKITLDKADNFKLMNIVPEYEEDGVTPKKRGELTLQKWVDRMAYGLLRNLPTKKALEEGQRILNDKIIRCKNRTKENQQ